MNNTIILNREEVEIKPVLTCSTCGQELRQDGKDRGGICRRCQLIYPKGIRSCGRCGTCGYALEFQPGVDSIGLELVNCSSAERARACNYPGKKDCWAAYQSRGFLTLYRTESLGRYPYFICNFWKPLLEGCQMPPVSQEPDLYTEQCEPILAEAQRAFLQRDCSGNFLNLLINKAYQKGREAGR
jgi:hypothetical protein